MASCWADGRRCKNLFMFQAKLKVIKQMMKKEFVPLTRGMENPVANIRAHLMKIHQRSEFWPNSEEIAR